ncbi:MAG: hypothetical protein FWE27_00155 [Defluviitaleaceae bacterium]|nr:hypothetical protein [Defluviitaleaceae bacterium]
MGNYRFRRSNYFKGKLLTSEDLIRDQNYFMDKHRFIYDILGLTNRVVRGLHVTKNNENTVSVCAGVAIDANGKEIFVEKSAVFELKLPEDNILQAHLYVDYSNKNITVDTRSPFPAHGDLLYAYLCIKHNEHKSGEISVPVEFSTGGRGFEYINEGYKLFWDYAGISGEKRDLLYLAKIGFTNNGHYLEIETIQNLPFGQSVPPAITTVPEPPRDSESEMRKDIAALTSSVGALTNLVRRLEERGVLNE